MNIAFCYESVLPSRGGCETYISDLSRRLIADGHEVHLYACRWDVGALPGKMQFHALPAMSGPRFMRPWRFAHACLRELANNKHDVTVGFDKTFGQDVLYPQGGLHAASTDYNLRKFRSPLMHLVARAFKSMDIARWSYSRLERRQYLGEKPPLIVVNSFMVRDHFTHHYGIPSERLHVVRSAIDPGRFPEHDRPKLALAARAAWGIMPNDVVALHAAMNYRLKGLDPLLRSVACLFALPQYRPTPPAFRLLVVGNPNTRKYERLAGQLGIRDKVIFAGHCPEMRRAYFAADFLVHPTFYDPCSLVVLEALACGLPVITTRANGASELLHPLQEGYVIDDPHDHADMASCMAQLLDGHRRHAASLAARKTASEWTFEHHYRALLEVFGKAARSKQAA